MWALEEGTPRDTHDETLRPDGCVLRRAWYRRSIGAAGAHDDGRHRDNLRMFFAVQNSAVIGGVACQRFAGLYPDPLMPEVRRYGYPWGVFVVPEARRAGVGEALTSRCIEALREDGCTHALLHAAPMGASVYERIGFQPNFEMRLTL